MIQKILLAIAAIAVVMTGCADIQVQTYTSTPPTQTVSTSDYEVTLEPLKAEGYNYYNRFRYQFTNKSSGDLTIDWSKSYYLRNGKRYGRFGWEGLTFEILRETQENPSYTIPAGKSESDEIFPLKLIGWREDGVRLKATSVEEGFSLAPLPVGENGLSIAVFKDGKVMRKKITVQINQD